jgi:hypothetical protein
MKQFDPAWLCGGWLVNGQAPGTKLQTVRGCTAVAGPDGIYDIFPNDQAAVASGTMAAEENVLLANLGAGSAQGPQDGLRLDISTIVGPPNGWRIELHDAAGNALSLPVYFAAWRLPRET